MVWPRRAPNGEGGDHRATTPACDDRAPLTEPAMHPTPRSKPASTLARARMAGVLLACATLTVGCAAGGGVQPLVAEQPVAFEGRVASVDLSPWAYDGNGVVVVDTVAHGAVAVQFPARWNLCRATPPEALDALTPGERVRVVATASGPAEAVVCADARHGLSRLP